MYRHFKSPVWTLPIYAPSALKFCKSVFSDYPSTDTIYLTLYLKLLKHTLSIRLLSWSIRRLNLKQMRGGVKVNSSHPSEIKNGSTVCSALPFIVTNYLTIY